MKKRVIMMGICFSLVLMILSGCAGKPEQARDDREPEDEAESETLEREETSRKDAAPSGVITGDTPEEIIEIFLDAFEEQDMNTMLSCCYLDEMVERYSFPDYVERIRAFPPNNSLGPVNSQFYRESMLAERKGEIARSIRYFTWSILLAEDEEWSDGSGGVDFVRPKSSVDYDWAEEFEDKVDPEQLDRIRILSIDEPSVPHNNSYQQTISRLCKSYGVDDYCDRVVMFKCGEKLFYKGFTLVQYDDQWQILLLYSAFLGDSAMGTATPVESEEDYWTMIE